MNSPLCFPSITSPEWCSWVTENSDIFYLFLIWLTPLELNVVGASWEVDLKCQYCTPLSSCHLELSDFSLGILYMHLPPSFFLRDGSIIPMKNQLNLVQIRENMVMFNAVGEQIFFIQPKLNWHNLKIKILLWSDHCYTDNCTDKLYLCAMDTVDRSW